MRLPERLRRRDRTARQRRSLAAIPDPEDVFPDQTRSGVPLQPSGLIVRRRPKMQQVLVQGLNGLSLAGILILVALGLWFIFGVLGVINLAHGELFMLGAYAVVLVHNLTGSVWLGMVLAPLMIAVLGLGIEVSVIKRLYERPFDTLLATWALSLIAREVVTLVTSRIHQDVPSPAI